MDGGHVNWHTNHGPLVALNPLDSQSMGPTGNEPREQPDAACVRQLHTKTRHAEEM